MKSPSRAISAMPRSGIREIMELAARRSDVVHLEVGEPDFATPPHVIEAAARAATDGFTKYTPNRGLPSVRETMARKISERNGFDVDIDQIIVTTGAVNGLVQSLMVVCDPGDVVLIPDPAWPNYEMMARAMNTPVLRFPLVPERDYLPDLETLDGLCRKTPQAKAIVINSPGNPTGGVFDQVTVEGLLEIAARHDLYVIADECYEDIVFEGTHLSPAALDDSGRVLSVFTVSKSYAMTGWRIGYVAASPALAPLISKLQEAVTACASSVAQKAAEAAIGGDQSVVAEMTDAYRRRRDLAADLLGASGLLVSRPHGAFYIMAKTASTGLDGYELCKRLVVESGVAVAPGETFGPSGAGAVRISLATAEKDLEEGIRRFNASIGEWSSRAVR